MVDATGNWRYSWNPYTAAKQRWYKKSYNQYASHYQNDPQKNEYNPRAPTAQPPTHYTRYSDPQKNANFRKKMQTLYGPTAVGLFNTRDKQITSYDISKTAALNKINQAEKMERQKMEESKRKKEQEQAYNKCLKSFVGPTLARDKIFPPEYSMCIAKTCRGECDDFNLQQFRNLNTPQYKQFSQYKLWRMECEPCKSEYHQLFPKPAPKPKQKQ